MISCANPGISSANLLIDRPPAFPFPEVEDLLVLAAARGIVPVGAAPAVIDPVAVVGNGTTVMVARGAAAPTLLLSDEGSLG